MAWYAELKKTEVVLYQWSEYDSLVQGLSI